MALSIVHGPMLPIYWIKSYLIPPPLSRSGAGKEADPGARRVADAEPFPIHRGPGPTERPATLWASRNRQNADRQSDRQQHLCHLLLHFSVQSNEQVDRGGREAGQSSLQSRRSRSAERHLHRRSRLYSHSPQKRWCAPSKRWFTLMPMYCRARR